MDELKQLIEQDRVTILAAKTFNRKKSKALNNITKSHTMLAQDSFLDSLLVLPVELWNGITG